MALQEKQIQSVRQKHFWTHHPLCSSSSKEQGEIRWWKQKQERYVRSSNMVTTCLVHNGIVSVVKLRLKCIGSSHREQE